ncbi:EamA family transporter RarD [Paucilactobacillus nenjiangensis]|jgi:chloramphenicol-sensitive protein RarD|uniref:EamA family transporter RarD n=1 Tax=Paucilactobacillus nenjiangensis TaxID=1296540 RepID=A0A5P1X322_9LACO|nr:EamA family transporter RarD [Paucilactobacillus nenjiangensis]QER67923.1 EamA family transporter RarD [Paucilactobacillus nenjiangensis]
MENKKIGLTTGLASYIIWGLLPIYWGLLHIVPAMNTLSYRIVWSMATMLIVITVQHDWRTLITTIKDLFAAKKLRWIVMASFLISINWFIYIYMVGHHQATEASLGYYIMPLMNIVVAVLFLHESLSRNKLIAISLALIGVIILTIQSGSLPLNTLLMAASFCLYGLIKKQVPLPATMSLTLETLFVFPIAAIYLIWFAPGSIFAYTSSVTTLLIFSGVITVIPLLLFAVATKNLDFITLSFIQYLNPTMQLLVAVLLLHEAFDVHKLIVFAFIWAGIIIFAIGSIRSYRQSQNFSK